MNSRRFVQLQRRIQRRITALEKTTDVLDARLQALPPATDESEAAEVHALHTELAENREMLRELREEMARMAEFDAETQEIRAETAQLRQTLRNMIFTSRPFQMFLLFLFVWLLMAALWSLSGLRK